jgi:dephospho-CoA kinase
MAAKVGLTGGIGSGKSTVATLFRDIGICVIDADQIAHQLTRTGTREFNLIVEYFGQQILGENGEIDRQMLGQIVFSDIEKRNHLESILHPAIRQEMQTRSREADGAYVILDIPLLIETDQYREMNRVLVITCPDNIRLERLMSNRDMSLEKAKSILSIQKTDAQRSVFANDVINNNADLGALEIRVLELHQQYCELFKP